MPIDKNNAVIERFQELLRSGKDYGVKYMYEEAAKIGFINSYTARKIVNKHYHSIISPDMIDFIYNKRLSGEEEIKGFSDNFDLCRRESILIIRYIRYGKGISRYFKSNK